VKQARLGPERACAAEQFVGHEVFEEQSALILERPVEGTSEESIPHTQIEEEELGVRHELTVRTAPGGNSLEDQSVLEAESSRSRVSGRAR
jgi:hypothetical protein